MNRMRDWIEKSNWWIPLFIKLLYPIFIFLGMVVGNYLIGYFGVMTETKSKEKYYDKYHIDSCLTNITTFNTIIIGQIDKLKENDRITKDRMKINRKEIVKLNNMHRLSTEDYPID